MYNMKETSQETDAWGCLCVISLAGLLAVQGGQCYYDWRESLSEKEKKELREGESIPTEQPVNLGNGSPLNLPSPDENYLNAPQGLDGRAIKIPPAPKEKSIIIPILRQLRWPRFEKSHRPQDKGRGSN